MNSGASTSVIVLSSLISTCSDGPAVSLKGSPTVSPTTAAAWVVAALAEDVAVLVLQLAGLDVLLGVVPGAAAVVQDRRHQDAGDRADHQQTRDGEPAGVRPRTRRRVTTASAIAREAEDQADDDRHADGQDARERSSAAARPWR